MNPTYDVIVVGAGHAGCEAALACARMGLSTLCFALHLDSVAYLACNPAIGGTSKGHLVREIDALGGQMGLTTDQTLLQVHMLNTRKGPAVHSLRAQVDKQAYGNAMRRLLESQPHLELIQAEVARIRTQGDRVCGVESAYGLCYDAPCVVVASGVYLNSRIITGAFEAQTGPSGLLRSEQLGAALQSMGIPMRRFKTGTPPRVDRKSIDFSSMDVQRGDTPMTPFSFMTDPSHFDGFVQQPCYLTYTSQQTHEILRANLHRSPMFSGVIEGTGARYCPSIEDKVVRFADKPRHQLFIEPEGLYTDEMYVQGFSTSMPLDVQMQALHTIAGLEQARIVRPGYAIEYDCIDGRCLSLSLMHREIGGLFFAGQVVGSSGYEEAAAQGLLAGINAARYMRQEPPLILTRMQAYAGVLIDDLVTKGTPEPYRMMTARAEYRLLLRQDNADFRLTEAGYQVGLATRERYDRMCARRQRVDAAIAYLQQTRICAQTAQALHLCYDEVAGQPLSRVLTRPGVTAAQIAQADDTIASWEDDVRQQAEIALKYEGYIARQQREVDKQMKMETRPLPPDFDYAALKGLRIEARQKLAQQRPANLGQASRISGVSPADIAILSIFLTRQEQEGTP